TLRIETVPVDLVAVVEAAVGSLLPAAGARGVTVERTLDAAAGPVLGDTGRLQQIVGNLLSNAVKFASEGGRVSVALAREDDHAVIRVADSGPGIDPAVLPHVFDRFQRGGGPPGTGHGGLGLGLAIAHHLVALHGGTLEAAPAGPLGGALFTVRLHCRSSEVPPIAGAEGRDATLPSLAGTRVLVVEDEADTRAFLTATLERAGGAVAAASCADEALAVLDAFRPDVLVADLRMPGKDGYALIREVRLLDAHHGHRLPALAVTAYAGPDEAERARAAGFDRYVSKPLEPAALIRAIVDALDGA
ncbi:MAG TPA: ATP-binding protein, partial [Methylomirabilota bacterium]|nr:ATP-binding protein [Methylomirabilota bacterium]